MASNAIRSALEDDLISVLFPASQAAISVTAHSKPAYGLITLNVTFGSAPVPILVNLRMENLSMTIRRAPHIFAAIFALVASIASPFADASVGSPDSHEFTHYADLEPNVSFWQNVFTHYSKDRVVLHDPYLMDVVYATFDVSDIRDRIADKVTQEKAIRARTEKELKRIAVVLKGLDGRSPRSSEEKRFYTAVKSASGEAPSFKVLGSRVRAQRGLGDQLCESYTRAKPYLNEMRQILSSYGVHPDLAYLPLVESGYRIGAHSSKGAVGMWQFTRGTGRIFLRIDAAADERRDPLLATDAAARLLKQNYEKLHSWPLAITAYNHGANGMANAVRKLGTRDLSVIAKNYKSRYFGFASRNFYAEFLAARYAMKEAVARCDVSRVSDFSYERVPTKDYVTLTHLAQAAGLTKEHLVQLNPALSSEVVAGKLRVPRGYPLVLPGGTRTGFENGYASLASSAKHSKQASYWARHYVRRGQTLSQIASMYRTSVSTLQRINGISNPRRLGAGRTIKVPSSGGGSYTASSRSSSSSSSRPASVRLRRGQTLGLIAKRYGLSVSTLQRHNGIANANRVRVGQLIRIPSGGGSSATASYKHHKVRRGQTLSEIARLYRTSVTALKRHNRISDPRKLRYGQVLKVPM